MRSKTITNSKGEPQATRIEIPIEGAGGALGMQAVTKLTVLISGLKNLVDNELIRVRAEGKGGQE